MTYKTSKGKYDKDKTRTRKQKLLNRTMDSERSRQTEDKTLQ
jgi:hypothetical protein